MDAIRKKMQSLKGETDQARTGEDGSVRKTKYLALSPQLYQVIRNFEAETAAHQEAFKKAEMYIRWPGPGSGGGGQEIRRMRPGY